MQNELLDAFETESGEIGFSFYKRPNDGELFVWLRIGLAGLEIPRDLVGDFLEVSDAIRIYLEDLEEEDE